MGEETTNKYADALLSIYDSLKLYDKDILDLTEETLTEVFFRKLKAYDIDLNKELGFTHLEPVKSISVKEYHKIINEYQNIINKNWIILDCSFENENDLLYIESLIHVCKKTYDMHMLHRLKEEFVKIQNCIETWNMKLNKKDIS